MSLINRGKNVEETYESVLVTLSHLKEKLSNPEYQACPTCQHCKPGKYTLIDSILDIGFTSRQTEKVWIACKEEKLNILLKTYCQKWENLN